MKINRYSDTVTMAKRCLLLSKRNPDTFITSLMLPALMMILFVSLFGNLIHVGDTSYVNYIVPGILLQCIGQCSSSTAIFMNRDVTNGMIHRFCTLPMKKSAILKGHLLEAAGRNLFTSGVVLLAAFCLGFRPKADLTDWCVVLLLLVGMILVMSWLAVIVGVAANSAEGASALSALAIILPYLSSGFVPVETLPGPLGVFAKYQPMTPVVDTMRNALLGKPLEMEGFLTAGIWCLGLIAVFYVVALGMFRRRVGQR